MARNGITMRSDPLDRHDSPLYAVQSSATVISGSSPELNRSKARGASAAGIMSRINASTSILPAASR